MRKLFVLLFFAVSCFGTTITGVVTDVYDGDTFIIKYDHTFERVRLIGIDAPELKNNRHGKADKVYGPLSRDYLKELVEGKVVIIELGVKERDYYGRILAYVYQGDTFVNLEMVKAGYAIIYTVPPDILFVDDFLKAQKEARRKNLGLWAIN